MRRPTTVLLLAAVCVLPGCHTRVKYVPHTKWNFSPREHCGYRDSDFDISRMMSLEAPSLTAHERLNRYYDYSREMMGDLGNDYFIIGSVGAASSRGRLTAKAAACKKVARRGGDIIVWLDRQDDRMLGQVTNTMGSSRAFAYGGVARAFGSSTSVSQQFAVDSSLGIVFRYYPEVDRLREDLRGLSEERLTAYAKWIEDDLAQRRLSEEEVWSEIHRFIHGGDDRRAIGKRGVRKASRPTEGLSAGAPATAVLHDAPDKSRQKSQTSTAGESPWGLLRRGMKAFAVTALIGDPIQISSGDRSEIWSYAGDSYAAFLDGELREWRE